MLKNEGNKQYLNVLGATLNESLELEKVMQMTVDTACSLIPKAQRAVFHLLDNQEQVLTPVSVSGVIEHGVPSLSMHIGEGIAGNVLLAGELSNVADVRQDTRFTSTTNQHGALSLLVVPVQRSGKKYGTISVQSEQTKAFTKDDEAILTEFAQRASIAIENAWLYEQANQNRIWAESLLTATAVMTRSLEPDVVLDAILEQVAHVVPARGQDIMLIKGDEANIVRHCGYEGLFVNQEQPLEIKLPINLSPFQSVISSGLPFVVSDISQIADWMQIPATEWIRSYAVFPLKTSGKVSGFLNVVSDKKNAFNENTIFQLRIFADHASIALYNAQLHEELKQALEKETEMRNRMIQHEHLASMGRMVSLVAHALNNPLQAMVNSLYLIEQEIPSISPAHEYLKIAQSDIKRLSNLVSQLRQVYKPNTTDAKTRLLLADIILETRSLMEPQLPPQRIRWEQQLIPDNVYVEGIKSLIIQLLLNICINAIEAMQEQPSGTITIACLTHAEEQYIGLSIQDTGKGIPEKDLKKIFDPYYSSKATKIGLGLVVCDEIIRQHNGYIEVFSKPAQGANFIVWLPIAHGLTNLIKGETRYVK